MNEQAIATVENAGLVAPIIEEARNFIASAKSESTLRAYRSDWQISRDSAAGSGQPAPASRNV